MSTVYEYCTQVTTVHVSRLMKNVSTANNNTYCQYYCIYIVSLCSLNLLIVYPTLIRLVSATQFISKVIPINDTDYGCHIKAVKLV